MEDTADHSTTHSSRSPHGERGLKFELLRAKADEMIVALLTESVD